MEVKKLDNDLWVFRIKYSNKDIYTYFLRYRDKIYYPSLSRETCKLVFDLHKRVKNKFKELILDIYCCYTLNMEDIRMLNSQGIYLNTEEILGWK